MQKKLQEFSLNDPNTTFIYLIIKYLYSFLRKQRYNWQDSRGYRRQAIAQNCPVQTAQKCPIYTLPTYT